MRVIFFYPGEEGTYVDNVKVTIYESGVVHLDNEMEITTTHITNCEVLWTFEEATGPGEKVRHLKVCNPEKNSTS